MIIPRLEALILTNGWCVFPQTQCLVSNQLCEESFLQNIYEYPTKVPNTRIRFRWTSCRGTMHQTLITDRGRPKNRYLYNLSVRVSCATPVGLSIEFAILQPFGVSSVDRDIPIFDIFAVSPTDTQTDTNRYPKAMANLSGKPSGQNSFGLHHENPYLQPFSASIKWIRCMYVLFHFQCTLST